MSSIINTNNVITIALFLFANISSAKSFYLDEYKVIYSTKGNLICKKFKSKLLILESKNRPESHVIRFQNIDSQGESNCKEIYLEFGFLFGVKLTDLNSDGLNDLILRTASGEENDILFIYNSSCLKLLESKTFLGETYTINNPKSCIYTYKQVGCSWESTFYKISNQHLMEIRHLFFDECQNKIVLKDSQRNNLKLNNLELEILKKANGNKKINFLLTFWETNNTKQGR